MEEEILKEIEEKENNKPMNEIVEIDENEEITNTQYDMEKVIPKKDEKKSKKPSKWSTLSKKTKIIIIVSIILVLIIAIVLIYFLVLKKDNNKNENNENEKEEMPDATKNNNVKENTLNENVTNVEQVEKTKDPTFVNPVDGEKIKDYSSDNLVYSVTLDEWTTHLGIDYKSEKTDIVKASADGKIKSIKNDPRYGLTVVIEHTNGFESVYSNLLTAEFITVGEEVKQGQTIATVGNTARFEIADETHLHF